MIVLAQLRWLTRHSDVLGLLARQKAALGQALPSPSAYYERVVGMYCDLRVHRSERKRDAQACAEKGFSMLYSLSR